MKKLILMWALMLTTIISFALPDGRYYYCLSHAGGNLITVIYDVTGAVVHTDIVFDGLTGELYGSFVVAGAKEQETPGPISREQMLRTAQVAAINADPDEVPVFNPSIDWEGSFYYFSDLEVNG